MKTCHAYRQNPTIHNYSEQGQEKPNNFFQCLHIQGKIIPPDELLQKKRIYISMKQSAVPDVATPACASAVVHSESLPKLMVYNHQNAAFLATLFLLDGIFQITIKIISICSLHYFSF